MEQPPSYSRNYSNFNEDFQVLLELYDKLLKLNVFIRKNGILLENEKKQTYIATMNLISELEDIVENDIMRKSDIDLKFRNLSRLLRVALISFEGSMHFIDLFIESNGTDMTQFNTLVETLSIMNLSLQNFRDSPSWNEVFESKTSDTGKAISATFVCESSIETASEITENVSNLEMENQTIEDYIEFAKCCDLDEEEFKQILKCILDPIAKVFKDQTFKRPLHVSHYSAIIGPSLMGKTQFSFILARIHPVFYFNFCVDGSVSRQKVYSTFEPYSRHVKEILNRDIEFIMKSRTFDMISELDSGYIFKNYNLKLFMIGFIWSLIEYSMEFDFGIGDGKWFYHYLKQRSATYTSLSLEDFYKNMGNLFADHERVSRFKIPIIFIDELESSHLTHIKLLRNMVRCLVLPCVLSSTNSNANNMLNLDSESTAADFFVWVSAVRRLLVTNLKGIMNRINFKTVSLIKYLNDDYSLKVGEDSAILLLKDLNILCDDENKEKLIKIWKFIIFQSKTCLQGSSFYAFFFVIKYLHAFSLQNPRKELDSFAVWRDICEAMHEKFRKRKPKAFRRDGKIFSLRMFATNEKFDENQVHGIVHENVGKKKIQIDSTTLVKNSINHHFYHFGEENEPSVLPFDVNFNPINNDLELELLYNGKPYPIKSHFLPFEKDTFTSFALWHKVVQSAPKDRNTIASISQIYINGLVGVLANPAARSNDYRAQEVMSYLAIANASHQSFHGTTKGVDFFCNFFQNIQILDAFDSDLFDKTRFPFPVELESFLNTLTIPYLLPDKPSDEFKSLVTDLCDFGVAYRCANETGMDIGFDVRKNGRSCQAFVECKYREDAQGKKEIKPYIDNAKSMNSVFTIFVAYKINNDLKSSSNCVHGIKSAAVLINNQVTRTMPTGTRVLRSQVIDLKSDDFIAETVNKKAKRDFKLNIYSFYFVEGGKDVFAEVNKKKLAIKIIEEHENPDGVFIVLESNFNARKV